MIKTPKTFYKTEELQAFLASHIPALYVSSKTSTVIPYDHLSEKLGDTLLVDLAHLPKKMELNEKKNLVVSGAVNWSEAKQFLTSHGRSLKTYPTEILATITAGVATSCTGERSFGYGNLRRQIVRLKYLDFNGEIKELTKDVKLTELYPKATNLLESYARDFKHYESYKNAPYPRFELATDLLIGSEGQLGVVIEAEIETAPASNVTYLFLNLSSWEKNYQPHLEFHHFIQAWRGKVLACELVDHNSMAFLPDEDKLGLNEDTLFLEILTEHVDDFFAQAQNELKLIDADQLFELSANRFHHIRASVPRRIFEMNSRMGVVKMGTDVQVDEKHFENLLSFYRKAKDVGIQYNLFGHFGDAHLHFNFMPKPHEMEPCKIFFHKLYEEVLNWKGSPFAEHGIGLLKKDYIKPFQQENQHELFRFLKDHCDPHRQFFPQGFMNI